MGLVVDLANSIFTVVPGSHSSPAAYAVANEVECKMAQFESAFQFRFDPKRGVPGPTATESWRIGVVQNVLYQKSRFIWDDGTRHMKDWVTPVVDSGALFSFPFYQDEPTYTRDNKGNRKGDQQTPFRDVYFNSTGFGELLDPWKKAPNNLVLKPDWFVTAADKPQFGCKLRTRRGGLLRVAEQIVTFGIWLVATDSERRTRPQVLAHVPPFTMIYSVEFGSGEGMMSLEIPASNFVVAPGRRTTVDKRLAYATLPGIAVKSGQGAAAPTYKGETANSRERHWAVGTILAV
jgi:hypothetical protein